MTPAVEGTPAVLSSFLPIVPIVSKETSLPNCVNFIRWREDVQMSVEENAVLRDGLLLLPSAELRWRCSQGQLHGVTVQ